MTSGSGRDHRYEVNAQWLPGGQAVAVNPRRIEVRDPAGQSLQTFAGGYDTGERPVRPDGPGGPY